MAEGLAQRERVVEGAEGVHAVGLAGQPAGGEAGGDDERVAVERGAVGQLQLVAGPADAVAGAQGDGGQPDVGAHAEIVERVQLGQHDPVGFPVAGEQLLGQRRPVVRRVPLCPDEADPPLEPGRTQLLGGAHPPESGADDDNVLRLTGHHPPLPATSSNG